MENRDLLEIARQLKELNKQKEIENYLKLYEITRDPKLLSSISAFMKYTPTQSEHDEEIDNLFCK